MHNPRVLLFPLRYTADPYPVLFQEFTVANRIDAAWETKDRQESPIECGGIRRLG